MNKPGTKILLLIFILGVLLIIFNQFDASRSPDFYTEKDLGPTIFDKSNGFYIVFALAEPPEVDILSDKTILKYRQLFDPQFNNKRLRFLWNQIAYRRMLDKYRRKTRFINGYKNDWVTFVKSHQKKILTLETELSFLLKRYQKLLECEIVSDFSTPLFNIHPWYPQKFSYPYPDETACLTVSRLHTALQLLEIQAGNTDAVQSILEQINFSKKLIESARSRYTNLMGKDILRFSLKALNSLMNQKDCSWHIFSRVLNGLKPLKYEEFGSRRAFIAYSLAAEEWVDNQLENVKRHTFMGDAGRLFLQKNRTKSYYFLYAAQCIDYEKRPPFQWDREHVTAPNLQKGSFWWLQNAMGKFIFNNDFTPDFQPDITASIQTKILYNLTRISAELHLNYIGDKRSKSIKDILNTLESYRVMDPYSGKPYIWNEKKGVLYSIGPNRQDDGGVYNRTKYLKDDPPDIAIPCTIRRTMRHMNPFVGKK